MKNKLKQKTSKKKTFVKVVVMLAWMVMGGVMGAVAAEYAIGDKAGGAGLISLGLLMFGMIAACYLQIIVHEAGHLVFGLLTGYQFSSFRIGSLMISSQDGKISWHWLKIAGTGGQCLMIPPALKDGKIPYVLYGFGGCIANLVASGFGYLLFVLCADIPFLQQFGMLLAVCGVGFALMNGIPMQLGVANDGYNVLAQAKHPDAMRAMWVQLAVNERLANGAHLGDLPADWLYMPDDDALQNVMVATVGVFYANQLLATQNFAEATAAMDHLLNGDANLCDLHRKLLICDQIYCALISPCPATEKAEQLEQRYDKKQKQFMKQMKQFPSVLRTRYAIELLHNNNPTEAEKVRKAFEAVAKGYPYQGDVQDERDLMALCQAEGKR